eukprot:1546532-Heterocapsa_arctica.AAC.1
MLYNLAVALVQRPTKWTRDKHETNTADLCARFRMEFWSFQRWALDSLKHIDRESQCCPGPKVPSKRRLAGPSWPDMKSNDVLDIPVYVGYVNLMFPDIKQRLESVVR